MAGQYPGKMQSMHQQSPSSDMGSNWDTPQYQEGFQREYSAVSLLALCVPDSPGSNAYSIPRRQWDDGSWGAYADRICERLRWNAEENNQRYEVDFQSSALQLTGSRRPDPKAERSQARQQTSSDKKTRTQSSGTTVIARRPHLSHADIV